MTTKDNQRQLEYALSFHFIHGNRDYLHYLEENDFVYLKPKEIYSYLKEKPKASNYELYQNLKLNLQDYEWQSFVPTEYSGVADLLTNSLKRKMMQGILSELDTITKKLNYLKKEEIIDNSAFHLMESFEDYHKQKGFKTGFEFIDEYTKRLKRPHFWIIGAYSNTGKTMLSVQMACNAIDRGAKVLFLSIETVEHDLMTRFWRYAKKYYDDNTAMDYFTKNQDKLFITSKIYKLYEIESYIQQRDYDVVIIDYLQLIEEHGSDYEKMSKIALCLAKIAKTTNTCIVGLSQVSEGFQKDGKNANMGFKGSGALGSAADVGIILKRDFDNEENDYADVECIIRKNRYGRTGKATIKFNKQTGLYL